MARIEHHAATDHVLRLADGRRLGYATFGDPDGFPVLNCHGGLVSRNDVAPWADDARSLGLLLVSPDRPGVSLSDRNPDASMLDWVRDDLTALLDALGIERFAVMGWSEGGQYALAVAHALETRVTRTACIAGCPPLDDPTTFAQLNRLDRTLVRLSHHAAPVARSYFGLTRTMARRAPERFARSAARKLGDAPSVLDGHTDWFAQLMADGASDTRGGVDEYRRFVAPWGFAPADVTVPVDVHQGTDDALVPEAWGRRLADELPNATYHLHEGSGHLVGLTHRHAILEALRNPAG